MRLEDLNQLIKRDPETWTLEEKIEIININSLGMHERLNGIERNFNVLVICLVIYGLYNLVTVMELV